MSLALRRLLFLTFVLAFLVTAPLIVLYTAGYRINQTTGRIQQTGVIATSTSPRSSAISLNGSLLSDRTPAVVQRLMPGTYDLTFSKRGYHDWTQRIRVESGRTTYVSALLLADDEPELLLEESPQSSAVTRDGRTVALLVPQLNNPDVVEVWLYDVTTRTQRLLGETTRTDETLELAWSVDDSAVIVRNSTGPTLALSKEDGSEIDADSWDTLTNPLPEIVFFDNGTNVEIRQPREETFTLLGVLPLSTYTIASRNEDLAFLHDARGRTFILNLSSGAVSQMDIPSEIVDWHDDTQRLLVSDGNEIDIVDPSTGEKTLITRQSEPFLSVAWHPSGSAIIAATTDNVIVIDANRYESRTATVIVDNANILSAWPDQTGRSLTFIGTINNITGIYRLKLVR